MSIGSRLRPSIGSVCARKHTKGMAARGQSAGGRGVQPFEALENRRLLSVSASTTGPSAAPEGDYTLGLSASGTSAGAISDWVINWGDGTISHENGTPSSAVHNYDAPAAPLSLSISATANGQVRTSTNVDRRGSVADVLVQPADGKVVTVGSIDFPTSTGIEVRRYDVTGAADPTFSGDGQAVIDFTNLPFSSSLFGRSVALDSQGRIVVAGKAIISGHDEFVVARFTPSGALDISFNGTGIVRTAIGANASANGVAVITADDRIVVGGESDGNFAVAVYNPSGSLDSSFDGDGIATADLGGLDTISAVALRTDGAGVVDGILTAGSTNGNQFALSVYQLNGAVAATRVETGVAGSASDVVFSGGQILVAGTVQGGTNNIGLFRYDGAGTPASGFVNGQATSGIIPTSGGASFSPLLPKVAVQADGKIVVGTTLVNPTIQTLPFGHPDDGKAGFGAIRFNADGTIDSGFGRNGVAFAQTARTDLSGGGIGLLPGGGIAQAGTVQDPTFGGTDGNVVFYAAAAPLGVTLTNVAPTVQFAPANNPGGTNRTSLMPGEVGFFEFPATDPSNEDAGFLEFHVDWGDGASENFVGGGFAGHSFEASGALTITVTASDDDGGSGTATFAVNVATSSGIIEDPANPGNTVLYVAAPAAQPDNNIRIRSTASQSEIIIDGVPVVDGPVDRIVVYGNYGVDHIRVTDGVSAAAVELYGGPGDDRLKAGNKNDIVVGGDGDDMLVGGAGRDFLVGGMGSDKLVGQSQDDILIGSRYVDAANRFAGNAVMAEWTSTRSYADRVANLRSGNGANSGVILAGYETASQNGGFQTVFDDGAVDKLTGNSGQDWFFANVEGAQKDKITDLLGAEFTDADRAFVAEP